LACRSEALFHISDLIRHHHEFWGGNGYTEGLKGEQIPLECRIFWVLDGYDALTNTRGTAGLFLGVGLIAGDKKSTETGVLATSTMLQSGILVAVLKGLFGRQRPYWAYGVDHWSGPDGFFERFESGQSGRYDSFPGGHSITAFSLATVAAMQYRESVWVPILAYATATGVALSRETENKHWLSDSLVSGVLGHAIGRLVVRNHRSRYHMTPATGAARGSLSLAFTFSFQ
jgi:membrane-associated phospholipid phosphatase